VIVDGRPKFRDLLGLHSPLAHRTFQYASRRGSLQPFASRVFWASPGFSLIEIIIVAALILLIGAGAFLGVRAARRISRDAALLSAVRSAQAGLVRYYHEHQSYPETEAAGALIPRGLGYLALPEGCTPAGETSCRGYEMPFRLEGRIGALAGDCLAKPEGLTCS
jgi:hypothetical protein